VSLIQANRSRANRSQVSLIRVNRIRRAEAIRTQAMPATVIRTAPATRPHPVGVTPVRAIRAVARAVNPIVLRVNRPVRKATANRRVNRIPKIQAAIVTRYPAILGQATRSQVTPVVVVPLRRVFPVKAKAIATQQATRRASPQVGQTVNRDPKANHQAAIVRRVGRVAIDQVTAKATACHGQPVTRQVVPLVIRRAALAADRPADLKVIPRHQPAIREIHLPVTQMIRQQVIPQIHPLAILMTLRPANRIARV